MSAGDVDRLMKHAHELERRGRTGDAEITYEAVADIVRLRKELTWQPIETAPDAITRDNPVIAWWPHLGGPVVAWHRQYASYRATMKKRWVVSHATTYSAAINCDPTHWMPMPAPPSAIACIHSANAPVVGSE